MRHRLRSSRAPSQALIAIAALLLVACASPTETAADQATGTGGSERSGNPTDGAGAAAAASAVATTATDPAASGFPRTADGRPRLDGIWQAMTSAYWDLRPHAAAHSPVPELGAIGAAHPGPGIVEGNEIPYQEWAREKQAENYANRLELDPETKCYLPGVPRAVYMPQPFQIFQTDDYVMIAYQYAGAVRTIHMNDPGPAPAESWMGWSIGRWEGDTLVVDVTAQLADTWFDRAGNHHSDALRVVERYTPVGRDHIQYQATIEDPNVFTRPWNIALPLYRHIDAGARLMEFKCVEFAEEKMYGHLRKQAAAGEDTAD